MAIAASQKTVTTSATLLASGQHGSTTVPIPVTVRNTDATVSAFLGGADVTTGTGFELIAGAAENLDLVNTDDLYAVVASGTVRVDVLRLRA